MTRQIGVLFWLSLTTAGLLRAQAPGVAIESPKSSNGDAAIIRQAQKLKEAGRLLSLEEVGVQLNSASTAFLDLPAPARRSLKPAAIYRLARQAKVQIGWFYLCRKCDHWHFSGAGGYPIAEGVLATCYHVVSGEQERSNMREAYLVAADAEGRLSPVTKVLAKSRTMDVAIIQAPGLRLRPLSLNTNVAPGDTVYCYSDSGST